MGATEIICEVEIGEDVYKALHAQLYKEMERELTRLSDWRRESLQAKLYIG